SFAYNLTPPLMEALLSSGLWSVGAAWAYVRQAGRPGNRVDKHIDLLISLTPWLNSNEVLQAAREALELLKLSPPGEERYRSLASLATLFNKGLIEEALAFEWDESDRLRREMRLALLAKKAQLGDFATALKEAKDSSNDYEKIELSMAI